MNIFEIFQSNYVQQNYGELQEFVNWLEPRNPRVILEIGFYKGGTAKVWKALKPDLQIEVDLAFPPDCVDPSFIKIVGDSTCESTLNSVRDALGGRTVDFLFIDGNHSWDVVSCDFKTYGPLVRRNGVIAFHDICLGRDDAKVHILWRYLCQFNNTVSFWNKHGPGIGVVIKS